MCLDETTLIRLLGGELSERAARDAGAHVRECGDCGRRLARLQGVWDALGQWQATPPPTDVRERIVHEAAREGSSARPTSLAFWVRVAACVVLAVGAGVAAAVAMTQRPGAVSAGATGGDELVQALGIDELGGQGALAAMLGQFDEPQHEPVKEEQP